MPSLEKAYCDIKTKFSNFETEPFPIVKSVSDHRYFWKPDKVKILLLAESHVYTSIEEHDQIMHYNDFPELDKCPVNYVRLVYCLGYGEKSLVNVKENPGTWQFWKIFTSCIHQNFHSEFGKILVGETKNQKQRLQNKISLLEKMKEKGIWLVDASIVAVYKNKNGKKEKPKEKVMKEILKITWEKHTSKIICEIKPEKIIVIGKCVAGHLKEELDALGIHYDTQNQPNYPMSKEIIEETFSNYYKWCNSSLEQK